MQLTKWTPAFAGVTLRTFEMQSIRHKFALDRYDKRWEMIQTWQLQEAKSELGRVIENAVNSGPQIITKLGVEVAIVLSFAEYQELVASRGKLSAFFRDSPLAGVELDLTGDKSEA